MALAAMHDPWNPSPDEIRQWAYDAESVAPCQDFDLAVGWTRHEKVLFECTSDPHCPKSDFFLRVLYLIVGDAVRSDYRTTHRPILEGFIRRGDEYPRPVIQVWQNRSRELLKHPDRFDYEAWCGGGLLRDGRS
jgi:hypothetical protein